MSKKHKGIIQRIYNSRTFKGVSVCLVLNMMAEIIQPSMALALTEGPSQPEIQSFEPVGTTQMVDLFTGDFNYNIPLFNLPGPNGGYPVNLAYHAGVTMDDEASWVGLGWNINVGSLVRGMRGLPDEFHSSIDGDGNWASGDFIETKSDMKENWTVGMNFPQNLELVGGQLIPEGLSASIYFNNYRGFGFNVDFGTVARKGPFSLGLSLDSENGLGAHPRLGIERLIHHTRCDFSLGASFDGNLSIDYGFSREHGLLKGQARRDNVQRIQNNVIGSTYSFAQNNFTPSIGIARNEFNFGFQLTKGVSSAFAYNSLNGDPALTGLSGSGSSKRMYYNYSEVADAGSAIKRPVIGYAEEGTETDPLYFTKDFIRQNDGPITKSSMVLANSYYSNDVYNSTGQGLSGYFRGRRNDVGRAFDPYLRNNSWGANLEIEFVEHTTTEVSGPGIELPSGVLIPINPPEITTTNHLGAGGNVQYGWDTQSAWDEYNDLNFDFKNPRPAGIEEVHYYQAHGEQTILQEDEYQYLNGTDLASVTLEPKNTNIVNGGKQKIVVDNSSNKNTLFTNDRTDAIPDVADRMVRNTLIHTLKNKEVEYLSEFAIKHYNFSTTLDLTQDPTNSLGRSTRSMSGNNIDISEHPAGFKILNQEGTYYIYGLPAYNNKEVENQFSIDNSGLDILNDDLVNISASGSEVLYKQTGTNQVINKTTKSPYAHSYLLTSVLGADYVDINNDGPSDEDLGYWVKFDYVNYGSDIKWRSPYTKANYNKGESNTDADDMGSYQYGEKEQWYLGRIETKSHVAIFILSERDDMKEAESEFDNDGNSISDNKSGLKIDRIEIYEKGTFGQSGAVPLQVVHFEYDYSLCTNSPNSDATGGGKLTLKKVWFTSNGSTRGELTPYTFDYTSVILDQSYASLNDQSSAANLVNPKYKRNSYDPWGGYHPYSGTYDQYSKFPYIAQTVDSWPQSWMTLYPNSDETTANKNITKTANDLIASAWCLRQIKLPSGGTIKIDYESDDYSHVQHKIANQMFRVNKIGNNTNELYSYGDLNYNLENNATSRRVYFKLEEPILSTSSNIPDKVYNDYVKPLMVDENGDRNLYFKYRVKLKPTTYEYISGYVPLESFSTTTSFYGVDDQATITIGGLSYYTTGYVTMQCLKKKNGSKFELYHPVSLLAWQYMQSNSQELLNPASGFTTNNSSPQSAGDILGYVTNFINAIPATFATFSAVRFYCASMGFAHEIDLDYSGIRLASPDRIKFGGGHRVREISITDNWSSDVSSENSRTNGQHFEYRTDEGEGEISSGVALYEPQLGGDENALKYPVHYYGKQNVVTRNNLMVEAPFNEALFPGPMVGYRKVTVTSLNTNTQLKNQLSGIGRTGGVTVHEFYTAKDFPTIVERSVLSEENNTRDVFTLPLPIPLIGTIFRSYYHGTQAFKIELNDMHGKPKSVKSYEIKNDYSIVSAPITEAIYEYQVKPFSYQGESVFVLDNDVVIMPNDGSHDLSSANTRQMGMEVELFTDQREYKSRNISLGVDFNFDFTEGAPPIPIPSFWPTCSDSKSMFRTYVTNKVVHRSGILKKSKIRDLQTINETEILAYDEKSGIPILSKVKNEFGDDFYDYNIPAYYHYDRMGHAYRNINYTFDGDIAIIGCVNVVNPEEYTQYILADIASTDAVDHLVRGDELLITDVGFLGNTANQYKKAYFLGWTYNGGQTYAKIKPVETLSSETSGASYTFKVIRSGRRNHYQSMAANYLSKDELSQNQNGTTPVGPTNETVDVPVFDNVLSASATVYKDDWTTTSSVIGTNGTTNNPFLSGNSGIWRPYKKYTYIGARSASASMTDNSTSDPELYNDGAMNSVPMFTWDIGDMEKYKPEWEWVSEVTRFSNDAYELENVNRLGIFSSALYGYDNSLTIAVGGNASYNEIGSYDFETSNSTSGSFSRFISQTNMNFDNNHQAGSTIMSEQFGIQSATMNGSNSITILTDIPAAGFNLNDYESTIGITLRSRDGAAPINNEGYYFNCNNLTASVSGNYIQLDGRPFIDDPSESNNVLVVNSKFTGKVTLLKSRNYAASPSQSDVTYSSQKAHTGLTSMSIQTTALFDQPQLRLLNGKKYILSLWISRDNLNDPTFEDDNAVQIGTMINGSFDQGTSEILTSQPQYSKIIEGWQKVDIEIEVISENVVLAIQFVPGSSSLYVDDVRFSPKTGGITTYVYDPIKYWLRASLNVDNYATLYYYDEEGHLTIKKQETEKGIFTITESRGHVSEN